MWSLRSLRSVPVGRALWSRVHRGLATTTDTCPFMFLFFMVPEELGSYH